MAFPTIPTVAAGRVLTGNQADASGTRTFPSLTGLTKNAGDELIAIIIGYQSAGSSGAVFSNWGGGFTELAAGGDQMTTSGSTMCIGIASKISDGSETGTFDVTQASPTGHASFILLSIPGAHATTPPEAGTIANGTSAAADPASFDPAGWAAEDTLWISVVGSGMTSGTGSWTATGTAAPASYTDRVDSNTTDNSTVGQTEAAVAFRQLNAASENVGTAGVDTSNARNSALLIAVRPAVDPTVVTPDPVAAVTAVPAAVVEVGALVAPSPVAAATAVPAATVEVGALVAPSPVAAVLDVPVPTVTAEAGGTVVTPSPVALVLAVPTATVEVGALVAPAPVAAVTAVPSAAVEVGAQVSPSPVAAVTAVPSAAVQVGALAAPAPVPLVLAVPTPSVDAGGGVTTVNPDPVPVTLAVPAAAVEVGAQVAPQPVVAALAVPGASVQVGAQAIPDPVAAVLMVPSAQLQIGVVLSPAPVALLLSVPSPVVSAIGTQRPGSVGAAWALKRGVAAELALGSVGVAFSLRDHVGAEHD